jgi:pimeloyl-ACP methyl ester carboxylesterase
MSQVVVQDILINYVKKGSKGDPLILIHGVLGDSSAYTSLIDILKAHFTVYAIDLPMNGKSDIPARYLSIPDMSDILVDFMKRLKIKNPTIFAHSAGCLIAIDYASKYNVKELILTEPAGLVYYKSKFRLFSKMVLISLSGLLRNPVIFLNSIRINIRNIVRNVSNDNFWKVVDLNYKKDYSEKIKKIRSPTTLILARYDRLFSYDFEKKFAKKLKNSRIISIEGYHGWPHYRPWQISNYLDSKERFIKR